MTDQITLTKSEAQHLISTMANAIAAMGEDVDAEALSLVHDAINLLNHKLIAANEPRVAYFLLDTEKDDQGFIPLIAKEGEKGYYRTDWHWGFDRKIADKAAEQKNESLGLSKSEAAYIVASTIDFGKPAHLRTAKNK